jgi:serine/threonine-protein kinase
MGQVWLAERNDGRFDRRVAVKFLNVALLGREGEERFKREGRILGRLANPHIAELVDAGVSQRGQPYLVLEYVDGEPIDQYCHACMLDVQERVRVFVEVLGAVAHAHANLIVHRDIKPSNVLVRRNGQVKLLDFGIAKLVERDEQEGPATLFTREGAGPLTPEYAAPEQLTGSAITTATDIYALGVLLYLLLSGQHPAGAGTRSPADLIKAIVETDPPRLSEAAPGKFRRAVRGDLETIVAKALKKNPQERYVSVTSMADDLRRYLAHEPINARPDTFAYRATKFVRRNRTAVVLAGVAVLASLAGVVGTMVQAHTANRERAVAQRRFNEVRQLSNKLFDIDAEARQFPGSTKTRQLIVDTSLEYLGRLSEEARSDPELALELSRAYMRVAEAQGVNTGRNLGQMREAERSLQAADELIRLVLASQPANRRAMLRAAMIAHDRMVLASNQAGRRENASRGEVLALARQSAKWVEKFNGRKDDNPEDLEDVFSIHMNVGDVYVQARQFDDALALSRRAGDLARSVGHRDALAMFLWVSAQVFQQQGELDEALKAVRESVGLQETMGSGDMARMMRLAQVLVWEGRILGRDSSISLGRSKEAAAVLERSFQISDRVVHQDSKDQSSRSRLALAGLDMAGIVRRWDARGALRVYDHMLRHLAEIRDSPLMRRVEANALAASSYPLQRLGRSAEARQRLDGAFERLSQLKFYPAERVTPGSVAYMALRARADFEAGNGNVARAIGLYEELLAKTAAANPEPQTFLEDAMDQSNLYEALADLQRRNHRADVAEAVSARRLELWRHWNRKLPDNAFVRRQLEAAVKQ